MTLSIFLVSIAFTYAQDSTGSGGFTRGGGGAEMRDRMRQRMKDELQLTDAQTDSVMNVQQDFQRKTRELKKNTSLSEDDQAAKSKEMETERNEKFKSFLSAEQVTKLQAFYEKMKKMREQRQNQGNKDKDK